MLHHDFSRAVMKDRIARFQDEAEAGQADKERGESEERSAK